MNIDEFTDKQLAKELITLDGKGKDFKVACLNELLTREYTKAREQGAFEQSFYSQAID